jgi:hypothetical protein
MSLWRYGSELERTCRSEDQNGPIKEGLVLWRRTAIGNVKDRLDDDYTVC